MAAPTQQMASSCNRQVKCSYTAYKYLMADKSQVSDGSVRSFVEKKNKQSEDVDKALQWLRPSAGYNPVKLKTSRRDHANELDPPSTMQSSSITEATASTGPSRANNSNPAARISKRHSYPTPDMIQNSKNNERPKSLLRHKSQPRHRNSSLNSSITGIIRPARYCNHGSNDAAQQDRRASMPARRSNSMPERERKSSFDTLTELFTNLNSEVDCARGAGAPQHGNNGVPLDGSVRSTESWIPLGVGFSPNMEVYVFEK